MEKFVPLNKRSKQEKKAHFANQRGSWNGLSPVSRKVESKKLYNRDKIKQQARRSREDGRASFI